MALSCLLAKGGGAYLPRRRAEALIHDGTLAPLADAPVLSRTLHVACHGRNRGQSPVVTAIDALRAIDTDAPAGPGPGFRHLL